MSSEGSTKVSKSGVAVERQTRSQDGATIVQLAVTAAGDDPVAVRFAESFPPGTPSDGVSIHPDYRPADTVFVDGTLLLEAHVPPDEAQQITYAVKESMVEADVAGMTPEILDSAPVAEGDQSPFSVPLADSLSEPDDSILEDESGSTEAGDAGDDSILETGSDDGDSILDETPDDSDDGDSILEDELDEDVSLAKTMGDVPGDEDDADPDATEAGATEAEGGENEESADEDEPDGPAFSSSVEGLDPDETDLEASFARGGAAADDGGPGDAGTASPDGPAAGPDGPSAEPAGSTTDAPDSAESDSEGTGAASTDPPTIEVSMVERLAEEIEAGEVDEEQLARLQSALGIDPPTRVEAKVSRVQSQIQDIEAYVAVMEEFIDEHGTVDEVFADVHAEIDGIRAEVEDALEDVEEMRAEVDEVDARGDDHAERLRSVSGDLEDLRADLEDRAETLTETTDELDSRIAEVAADLSDLAERHDEDVERLSTERDEAIAEVAEDVRSVADELESLSERHDADVADIETEIEELEAVREKLSSAFTPAGTGDDD